MTLLGGAEKPLSKDESAEIAEADQVMALENAARLDEQIPASVVSMSCGLVRISRDVTTRFAVT